MSYNFTTVRLILYFGSSLFQLQQICKILNAHMDSLQWIDQSSGTLYISLALSFKSIKLALSKESECFGCCGGDLQSDSPPICLLNGE